MQSTSYYLSILNQIDSKKKERGIIIGTRNIFSLSYSTMLKVRKLAREISVLNHLYKG